MLRAFSNRLKKSTEYVADAGFVWGTEPMCLMHFESTFLKQHTQFMAVANLVWGMGPCAGYPPPFVGGEGAGTEGK